MTEFDFQILLLYIQILLSLTNFFYIHIPYMLNSYWQEAISIGIITSLIGMFSLFFIKKYEEIDHNEAVIPLLKKRYWLNWQNVILCFILGVAIHIIIEFIGLNQWYCNKKCAEETCVYVCQKPVGINFFGERTKIFPISDTNSE